MAEAGPGVQESLSRERIARAALALADREGFDRLTMRRLAAELGVGTMTLYGYFKDKDELIDAAIDVASEEGRVAVGEGSWKDQLAELMRGIRRALDAHPSGMRLRLTRPMLSSGALRTTEAGMQILAGAGFRRDQAARAYRTLFVYTFGFASFSTPAEPEALKRQTRAALTALSPEEFPMLSAAVEEAAEAMAGDAQFEFGLSLLIDGLESQLERTAGARPPRSPRPIQKRDRE